jgi:hypothetical protein
LRPGLPGPLAGGYQCPRRGRGADRGRPRPTLVGEAERLAHAEGLNCHFIHGNAFDLPKAATVYVSTGVLHHFRGPALATFFQAQAASPAQAFCHFDIAATRLAPIGAWVFHRARMRHPLGRHDGVVSARRAHSDETLLRAADVPGIRPLLYEPRGAVNPFCTTLRPVIGVRPQPEEPLRRALGRAISEQRTGLRPIMAFLHANLRDEQVMREQFARVHVCRRFAMDVF